MDPGESGRWGRAAQGADAGAAVGIDLGTSNTVVAHVDAGLAQALTDWASDQLVIPSVCAFHPSGVVLVGQEAKDRRLQDPKNTVFSTKRLPRPAVVLEGDRPGARTPPLRAARREELERPRGRAEQGVHAPRDQRVRAAQGEGDRGSVGREIGRSRRHHLPGKLRRPPARRDEARRQAGGLQVLRVLNEPTAAALAYGYGKEGQERISSTTSAEGRSTSPSSSGEAPSSGSARPRATATSAATTSTARSANRIAEGFAEKHFYDPRADKQVFEHVREAAEKLKVKLSKDEQASIELVDVAFGVGGKSLTFSFPPNGASSRRSPFVHREDVQVCKKALANAGVEMKDIDQVLLVGGARSSAASANG